MPNFRKEFEAIYQLEEFIESQEHDVNFTFIRPPMLTDEPYQNKSLKLNIKRS